MCLGERTQRIRKEFAGVFQDATRNSAAQILAREHGIFIHLEDGHRTYWGIVAYLPSESKPDVDASRSLVGHPPLSDIPKER